LNGHFTIPRWWWIGGALAAALLAWGLFRDVEITVPPPGPPPAEPTAPAAAPDAARAAPEDEIRAETERARLQSENDKLREQLAALLQWIMDNFRGKYPLNEQMLERLHLQAVGPEIALHPEVIDFLNISPAEQSRINDALYYARIAITLLEQQRMRWERTSPDAAQVEIASFPEDGERLREHLYAALDQALGPVRSERFLRTAGSSLETNYSYFGRADRRLAFSLDRSDPAAPRMNIRDEWTRTDGDGRRRTEAVEFTVEDIPDTYKPYLQQLLDTKS